MIDLSPVVYGLILASIGAGLILLVWVGLRWIPSLTQPEKKQSLILDPLKLEPHNAAVILVKRGGQLIEVNQQARKLFDYWGKSLNLEYLARRTRPSEAFLALCAVEGLAHFTLNGRMVVGSSYLISASSRNGSEEADAILVTLHPPQWSIQDGSSPSVEIGESQPTLKSNLSNQSNNILNELIRSMTSSLDFDITLKTILENINRLLPSDSLEVGVWDKEERSLATYHLSGTPETGQYIEKTEHRSTPGKEFHQQLIESGNPIQVNDIQTFHDFNSPPNPEAYPYRSFLGVPLLQEGELVGTLELASLYKEEYNQSDLEVMRVVAEQAAIAINNAQLFKQEQQRARELAGLANLASTLSVIRDPQDLFARLLETLSPILPMQVLGFLIYDENLRMLESQEPFIGIPANVLALYRTSILPGSQAEKILLSSEPIVTSNPQEDDRFQAFDFHHMAQVIGLVHTVLMPLTSSDRTLGYLQAGNKLDGMPFDPDDLRLIAIIARQVAALIENATFVQSSRRRFQRAETLRRISSLTSSTATLDEILKYSLLDLARLLQADVAAVFLLDEKRKALRVHRDSVFGISIELISKLPVINTDDPLFLSTAAGSGLACESSDVLESGELPPLYRPVFELLEIRSFIDVPLMWGERVHGEIVFGSFKPAAFLPGDAQSLTVVAGQLAAAVEKSNLEFPGDMEPSSRLDQLAAMVHSSKEVEKSSDLDTERTLERRNQALSIIRDVGPKLKAGLPLEKSLEIVASAIRESTASQGVSITVYDPTQELLIPITYDSPPTSVSRKPAAHSLSWQKLCNLLQPEFNKGSAYIIPAEHPAILELKITKLFKSKGRRKSNPNHILLLPLFNSSNEPLGSVFLEFPPEMAEPDATDLEALEFFGTQAAALIENHLKTQVLQRTLSEVQEELARNEEETKKALTQLKDSELKELSQNLAIEELNLQTQRIKNGLEVINIFNQQTTRLGILRALAESALMLLNFDIAMVAETIAGNLKLVELAGTLPTGVNPESLFGQRNPLWYCLNENRILTVEILEQDTAWNSSPLLRALETASFVCLPVGDIDPQHDQVPSISTSVPGGNKSPVSAAILVIKRSGKASLTPQDEHLLRLISHQAATAMGNLALMEDISRRLGEVDLLLNFSREMGSLEPDSILKALVETASTVVTAAQATMVALWDPAKGGLVPKFFSGYEDGEALLNVLYQPGEGLPGQAFEQAQPIFLEEVSFSKHHNFKPENLKRYREATGGRFPVSSLVVPVMTGIPDPGSGAPPIDRSEVDAGKTTRPAPWGIVILDNMQTTAAFTNDDLAVVVSLAQQTALSLENAHLYQVSRQRGQQLQALAETATSITGNLQPDELVGQFLDQLSLILHFDNGTLWLRQRPDEDIPETDPRGTMVIRAARGFADNDQRVGLTIDIRDSSLMKEMILNSKPINVPNVMDDPRFIAARMPFEITEGHFEPTAEYAHLSWLGVPMIASGKVIGVIALEKTEPYFFAPEDIQIAATFAGQAAAGLENAKLYQESFQRAVKLDSQSLILSRLNQLSGDLSRSLDTGQVINYSVQEVSLLIPTQASSFLMLKPEDDLDSQSPEINLSSGSQWILQAEHSNIELDHTSPIGPGSFLPGCPLLERLISTRGILNCGDTDLESELEPLRSLLERYRTRSVLIIPIAGSSATDDLSNPEDDFQGLLLLHGDQPYRFSAKDIELARTICNQIGIALQNAVLFERTQRMAEELEIRVQQRTSELQLAQRRVEILLKIFTELTSSLDLDHVVSSTLRLLSEYADAKQITILIARPSERYLYRLGSYGPLPLSADRGGPTPLSIDQGLAGWIITNRKPALISDVLKDDRWVSINYPDDGEKQTFKHRSAIGVPLLSGAEALGCLLLFHHQTDHFNKEHLDLVQAAAHHVSVAVNNAELYRLIRDQAEDLGTMLRNQQIETSRSKAILESVADGVLVTNSQRQITLFNASAEKILKLDREQVLDKTLDQFIGLFGRDARQWMEKISSWSTSKRTPRSGDNYEERLQLEDGRVIAVRLAPVNLGVDFLGTVSIFQDITHQVEVDRLKSEFVATVSHELRTPMTSIKGYVEILLMGAAGKLTAKQKHFLHIVKGNTDRLVYLVNDLLDVSKLESGLVNLVMQPTNLEVIVDQSLADISSRSQEEGKTVKLQREIQPDLPRALCDPERIRQVFKNLLDNAYNYNQPDGTILVRLKLQGDQIQVDVKDSGVGINSDELPRIFERFFRGENPLVLGVSGSGLGLSIVKNLVEMHQGRIWVTSPGIPGAGSTFSFTLPVYERETEWKGLAVQ